MSTDNGNGDNTCASRYNDSGYVVTYYGIGDPWPQDQPPTPHPDTIPPSYPYPTPSVPYTLTPQVNDLKAFKQLADSIRKLAKKMPGRKKVKKLMKRLKFLEERVTELERALEKGK